MCLVLRAPEALRVWTVETDTGPQDRREARETRVFLDIQDSGEKMDFKDQKVSLDAKETEAEEETQVILAAMEVPENLDILDTRVLVVRPESA